MVIFVLVCGVYDSIRGGPLEITGGWVNFFFLVQIVCMNFFFDVKALHDFFFDSTFSYHTLVQFTCSNFFLVIVTPPPPPPSVISNGPPLSHKSQRPGTVCAALAGISLLKQF